jgi:hypothetical protein
LEPLFVFGYSSSVVVEGACVRDFRGLGVCTVVMVDCKCVGGMGNGVTSWGRQGKDGGESDEKGQNE